MGLKRFDEACQGMQDALLQGRIGVHAKTGAYEELTVSGPVCPKDLPPNYDEAVAQFELNRIEANHLSDTIRENHGS